MKKKTSYNVRIVDNGNGTFSLGFVSRFKTTNQAKDTAGTWVEGSRMKIIKLLNRGTFKP